MVALWQPDFANSTVLATTAASATVTVPQPDANLGTKPLTSQRSAWFIIVAGVPCAIKFGPPGSSPTAVYATNSQIPVGMLPVPFRIAPGTVIAAITAGGNGQISIVPAHDAS